MRILKNFKMANWTRITTFGLFLLLVCCLDFIDGALRNVSLIVEPPAVRRGQHATLRCLYDLSGAPLYSVKFYRGQLEFYRYTPGEIPNTKVFPFPGLSVIIPMSNASQVVIRKVGFGLSGNFSCEVTADAPLFSTATAFAQLQVVEYPEKRPILFTEHNRYEPGDVLRANCSTPPSRPRAELKFTINNMVVSSGETEYIRAVDSLMASRISLKLQLQAIHFTGGGSPSLLNGNGGGGNQMLNSLHNNHLGSGNGIGGGGGSSTGGSLVLRCTAQIGDLYQEYKEIELGTPQRDPIPARVTLSSGSGLKSFFNLYFSSSSSSPSALQTKLLAISIASGVIGTFHWLQYRYR